MTCPCVRVAVLVRSRSTSHNSPVLLEALITSLSRRVHMGESAKAPETGWMEVDEPPTATNAAEPSLRCDLCHKSPTQDHSHA